MVNRNINAKTLKIFLQRKNKILYSLLYDGRGYQQKMVACKTPLLHKVIYSSSKLTSVVISEPL
jgi:hypothetical protein